MNKRLSVRICILFIVALTLLFSAGCNSNEEIQETLGENQYLIYYLDSTGMELATEVYTATEDGSDTSALVDELLSAMSHPDDSKNHISAIPNQIVRLDRSLNDEVLSVYFSESYYNLAVSDEVMFRAAYVKTMTQIMGIKYVCFYVNDQPLQDAMGNTVGIMLSSDFMEDIGSGTYRTWVDLSVYYGSLEADRLAAERITVGYGRNASIERVIIDQLIKGPAEEGHVRTVPDTLTLLSVSTKEGICYVNFDASLKDTVMSVPPAVTIYSIVNSLCELSNINMVQISIKGDSSIVFKDVIDLSMPLERNLDIVEGQ